MIVAYLDVFCLIHIFNLLNNTGFAAGNCAVLQILIQKLDKRRR